MAPASTASNLFYGHPRARNARIRIVDDVSGNDDVIARNECASVDAETRCDVTGEEAKTGNAARAPLLRARLKKNHRQAGNEFINNY